MEWAGRPTRWSAGGPLPPTAPNLLLVGCPSLPLVQTLSHGMSYKQFCFGLWACFDPIKPELCPLIGLRLLP